MPVIITPQANESFADPADVEAILFRNDRLTLEGQVIQNFVQELDPSAVIEALSEVAEKSEAKLVEAETGELVESAEGEDSDVETIDGALVAEVLDEEDLLSMFEHYVTEMPNDTIEEKTRKAAALALLGEEAVDEAAKGTFRKLVKKGPAGRALVNRMLGAMIAKQVIKRAKAKAPGTPRKSASGFTGQGGTKGAGYKGGDYEKYPPGWSEGTPKGWKVWKTFKKGGTGKASALKQERKTKAAKKHVKYKLNASGTKVKQVLAAKAKPGGGSLAKKAMGESATGSMPAVNEMAQLAGRAVARQQLNG